MDEFVRIRLSNGREVSVSRAFAAHLGDDVEVLDAPATNNRGRPVRETLSGGRRAKRKTTVNKEAAKKAASSTSTPSEPGDTTTDGVAVDQPQEAIE